MENFENQPVESVQPPAADLQAQLHSLQQSFNSLLCVVLIVSGTLTIYLLRQFRTAHAEVVALRQVMSDYNKVSAPAMTEFVRRLNDFERTHPDLGPILAKYGMKPPAGNPAPAAPPAAPKK
jgi:hypothetical protein